MYGKTFEKAWKKLEKTGFNEIHKGLVQIYENLSVAFLIFRKSFISNSNIIIIK